MSSLRTKMKLGERFAADRERLESNPTKIRAEVEKVRGRVGIMVNGSGSSTRVSWLYITRPADSDP
jgi:succinyl-CoA synthetase beta subunit